MILQGSLRLEYKGTSYLLNVKTILKDGVYYFYVTDKDQSISLLDGETVEMVYKDAFCENGTDGKVGQQKVTIEIKSAIEKLLLDNIELWYY
jgi:hypothetical protein